MTPNLRIDSAYGSERRHRRMGFALALLLIALPACDDSPPRSGPSTQAPPDGSALIRGYPRGTLTINRDQITVVRLQVEIAETAQHRATGLMGIDSLPDRGGMVFLMPEMARGGFYMKDTLIPLDIAFWNSANVIVDMLQMEPCRTETCPSYFPDDDYIGAVEVQKGLLDRYGVAEGDTIELARSSPRTTSSR